MGGYTSAHPAESKRPEPRLQEALSPEQQNPASSSLHSPCPKGHCGLACPAPTPGRAWSSSYPPPPPQPTAPSCDTDASLAHLSAVDSLLSTLRDKENNNNKIHGSKRQMLPGPEVRFWSRGRLWVVQWAALERGNPLWHPKHRL